MKDPKAKIEGTHKPTYSPSSLNPLNHKATESKKEMNAAASNKTVDFLKFPNIFQTL